jgi:hypothetical protein
MENINDSVYQVGVTVDITRQLETVLENLGATGKGLHEKATSLELILPKEMLKKLRYIASVRNQLLHKDITLQKAEFNQFIDTAKKTLVTVATFEVAQRPHDIPPQDVPILVESNETGLKETPQSTINKKRKLRMLIAVNVFLLFFVWAETSGIFSKISPVTFLVIYGLMMILMIIKPLFRLGR